MRSADLSDAAYRTHHELISALYALDRDEVTELRVAKRHLHRHASSPDTETAMKDLVAAGFWRDNGAHWTLGHHAEVMRGSLATQRRKAARDRRSQTTYRGRHKPGVSADVSADPDRQTEELLEHNDRE